MWGDSRAAVVISTRPLLIAAYTDEIDCVAMLRFDNVLTNEYGLKVGSRLLTVNTYSDLNGSYEKDLTAGSKTSGMFGNVHPFIAEFLTDDVDRLEKRKAEIDEDEWSRTNELGKAYVATVGALARDGRPVLSAMPASLPLEGG